MISARRFAAAFAASLALLVGPACAAPRTPCDVAGLPAPVEALRARLDSRDPAAWATIARDAAALTASGSPAARACAHYSAGAAWFFLSGRRADRVRHAVSAVTHLVAAEALAPEAMRQRQPKSRLQTAWSRVGTLEGWLDRAARPVSISLPARAGSVVLTPGDPRGWKAACGGACPAQITIPLDPTTPRAVHLRPGRWTVALNTACGARAQKVQIESPPCAVQISARDANTPIADVALLDARGAALAQVTAANNPVTVTARGYLDETVRVPPDGGEMTVAMTRCAVQIVPHVRPPDAQVEGAGSQPWGALELRAKRPGYRDLTKTVHVPPPTRCVGARQDVDLALERPVAVVAIDDDGEPVVPARLWVNEAVVDAASLALPVGLYRFQAEHPGLGTVSGAFTVRACEEADCLPSRLRVRFSRASKPSRAGPWWVMGAGGLVTAVGVGFGAAAFGAQRDIDAYTTRVQERESIDTLIARRDHRAGQADAALFAGGAILVGGLIWYLVGD